MKRKQTGMTMISWMVVLGLVAVQAVMALRIIPVYMNYGSLKTVMDGLTTSVDAKKITGKKLDGMLRKRLSVNSLYDLAKDKKAFKYKKIKGGYTILANYESRGPIFGNLEFVATFEYQVDVLK